MEIGDENVGDAEGIAGRNENRGFFGKRTDDPVF